MGLLTGLLTLPLAPVRGTIWLAERLVEEAQSELGGNETSLRRRLAEAELAFELGQLDESEYEAIEDDLLERLELARERSGAGV
jgi:Gas vesicle protein G